MSAPVAAPKPDEVEPLPGELRRFHVTVSKRFLAKLAAARDALSSTTRLELDHIVPVARGGTSTPGNIRILCAFHNQLAARQAFGEVWMGRFLPYGAAARRNASSAR